MCSSQTFPHFLPQHTSIRIQPLYNVCIIENEHTRMLCVLCVQYDIINRWASFLFCRIVRFSSCCCCCADVACWFSELLYVYVYTFRSISSWISITHSNQAELKLSIPYAFLVVELPRYFHILLFDCHNNFLHSSEKWKNSLFGAAVCCVCAATHLACVHEHMTIETQAAAACDK